MASQLPSSGLHYSSSSAHRLPTISASEVLRQIRSTGGRTIPTGLDQLDIKLAGTALSSYGRGGLVKGQLTEVFGPPGSGKTALALQIAASAIRQGDHVVWIDCSASLPRPRVQNISGDLGDEVYNRFHHYNAASLAHLLALVRYPKQDFPPTKTALMVIDDATVLFPPPSSKPVRWPSTARTGTANLQSTLLSTLSKIAASHNLAVLLNTYVSTRIRSNAGAVLVASHGSKDWDNQLSSRVVLFRDFPPSINGQVAGNSAKDRGELLSRLRYAGIIKAHGASAIDNDMFNDVVSFSLLKNGSLVAALRSVADAPPSIQSPTRPKKRRLEHIPDSEDEWDEELESLGEHEWNEAEDQTSVHVGDDSTDHEVKKQKLGLV